MKTQNTLMTCLLAILSLACAPILCATEAEGRHTEYLNLLEKFPNALGPVGNWEEQEIQLVTDADQMREIEASTGRTVGIVARDRYWLWLNDPVIFPSGRTGVYGRIMWNRALDGVPGVAVLPYDPVTKKLFLIRTFRHATRSWELELPRGCRDAGESFEEAAKREVLEETGLEVGRLQLLGIMAPDTGKTGSLVPIVLAEVTHKTEARPDISEAIAGLVELSLDECQRAMRDGFIIIEGRSIPVRDSFVAYALLQLMLR